MISTVSASAVFSSPRRLYDAVRMMSESAASCESAGGGRDKWRSAIDIVENLAPRWIVAGHKNKDFDDTATRAISETRNYLDSADELLAQPTTAVDFFNAMLERFPDRINPSALWLGAAALCR